MRSVIILGCFLFMLSCSSKKTSDIFKPIEANFNNRTVILPEGFSYKILFQEGDTVVTVNGMRAPAKGSEDLLVYIPIDNSNEHGYLYVSHESHKPNPILGDGGGATILEIVKENDEWKTVGDFRSVDFSTVGETFRNCGGTLTPHGTILTAEEEFPTSNTEIFSVDGITDTSDFNGKKKYLNYGFMVEVDPKSGKALRKLTGMGRYSHEDAHCMPDGKTVYLTSDSKPAVIFKFIAQQKGDYSKGQLYAYAQSSNAESGYWIALPMSEDSLLNITEVAVRMGAGIGIRHEWADVVDNKLYITETGSDAFSFAEEIKTGGKPFHYFKNLAVAQDTYKDVYGRVLELDLTTNKLSVLLEGRLLPSDSTFCFSNPDAMTAVNKNGKNYLVISEDCNGNKDGRVSAEALQRGEVYNEIYFLDLSIKNPSGKDLKRFMAAPEGCETTGNCFTPDGKSYFVCIQHPSTNNPAPFNRSTVLAISGF